MSEPGYIELQSGSARVRDYARGIREGGCPECGHDSLVVTQALVATRVDPACWAGRCTCEDATAMDGTECPDCGLSVSGIHAVCDCELCDSEGGCSEPCDCECHCTCEFET